MDNDDLTIRFQYHPPKNEHTKNHHEQVRQACWDAARIFNRLCVDGRELSLAVTKLEEALFWANASIARHPDNIVSQES